MSDDLLPYYSRELAFIRKMGAEFAEQHPEVAAALRLGPDGSEDPHVERMVMAFSYLAARIRHKLDDDFPELTTALMGTLYPHYLAPIPSMAIVEFQLDRGQGGLVEGYTIDRGRMVETEPVGGEPCRFRTAYPVTIFPVEVAAARIAPVSSSTAAAPRDAVAALRIELSCFLKDMTFSKLKLPRLRFFLNGQAQHTNALYELIFNNTVEATAADAENKQEAALLGRGAIRQVGFAEEEGMLPYTSRSFPGFRLLSEYFAFPEKFRFFDLVLSPQALGRLGSRIEICLYTNRTTPDLEHNTSADTFRLGCAPIVNLYEQRSEPIRLTLTESEYRVVPDARRVAASEVYSIDSVTAASPAGESVQYQPFYSFRHAISREKQQTFWYAIRKASSRALHRVDHGTEVYLSLVDLGLNPLSPANWTLVVETTCLNRDLPRRLPFGGGQPALQLALGGPVARIACLTPPTPTLRPPLRAGLMWRLISHLSLNHLSLFDRGGSADALREILKLYDFADSSETRAKIAGIAGVRARRAVGRPGGRLRGDSSSGFVSGIGVDIEFDEERFSDNGMFLLASVLERFLGLYCTVNSFTQLSITTRQREGVLKRWPPRAAEKTLL